MIVFCSLIGPSGAEPTDPYAKGRAIYNFRCYFCHGYSGNARTLASTYLNPKPTDFTLAKEERLTSATIMQTLESGRSGTAMQSFRSILSRAEMEQVAEFVAHEFVKQRSTNTYYHTRENGWENHSRYRIAFPFATGEIPISRSWELLTPEQVEGKRLYLSACVTCHDRGAAVEDTLAWEASKPMPPP